MAVFAINEWLWADLSGSNGNEAQREAFSVIENLPSSNHRIVVIEGSKFDQKAWNLCRNAQQMTVQRLAGIYVSTVRVDSNHCQILKAEELVDLTVELASATKLDDHYLIQALLTVEGTTLVTTDNPLREVLLKAGLSCISREEFLNTYF